MTGTQDSSAPEPPMEAYNRRLLAQIEDRIRQGLAASMQDAAYRVIRNPATGVLTVLASTTVDRDPHQAFGPAPFAQCLDYVNATVVTRIAEETEHLPAHPHGPHAPGQAMPHLRNDPERNAK